MWPGPNGVGSSLKYLISSLDESLKRLGLDYVDIFYSHRYDSTTSLDETADALDLARRSGRCLYVGISSYPIEAARKITEALEERGTPVIINQSHYNLFSRWVEPELIQLCRRYGTGFAAFSPLAQGLLSNKYVTAESATGRAAQPNSSVYCNDWVKLRVVLGRLNQLAQQRGQTIAQLALSWVLRQPGVCTAVIGIRTSEQMLENVKLNTSFTDEEEQELSAVCEGIDVNLWKESRSA